MGGLLGGGGRSNYQKMLNRDWSGHALGSTAELRVHRPTSDIKWVSGWCPAHSHSIPSREARILGPVKKEDKTPPTGPLLISSTAR
jgi:hypothetical protein